jgi:hypothetical protein
MMTVLVSHSLRRPMRSTMVAPNIETMRFHTAAETEEKVSKDSMRVYGKNAPSPPLIAVCSFGSVTPTRRRTGVCVRKRKVQQPVERNMRARGLTR